jgi:uncharacterized protein
MQFKCLPDCADCCGIQITPTEFYEAIKHKQCVEPTEIIKSGGECVAITEDGMCVWLDRTKKRCNIYESRPLICRLYGFTEDLPCPHLKPNGNPRSEADKKRVDRQIKKFTEEALKRIDTKCKSA